MSEVNNEIDLVELYQKSLVFIFKNFLTFFIFGLIGLLIGTAFYYKSSNIIKANYLAESTDISKELVFSLTDRIAFSIEKNDLELLNHDLKLDNSILENITKLTIDTSKNILNISIIAESNESLLPFTEALVNYYNNQEFVLEKQKQKQKETREYLDKVNEEIISINKFQEQFLNGNKDGSVTINQMNGSHSEKLNLYKMKQKCEQILLEKNAISLINKNDNIIRKDISLLKTLALSVLISIVFAFIYFFIRFSIALKNKA